MAKEKEYIYDLRKFTQYDHVMGDAKKNLTKVGLCVSLPKKYINLRSGVFFSSFSPLAEKRRTPVTCLELSSQWKYFSKYSVHNKWLIKLLTAYKLSSNHSVNISPVVRPIDVE